MNIDFGTVVRAASVSEGGSLFMVGLLGSLDIIMAPKTYLW